METTINTQEQVTERTAAVRSNSDARTQLSAEFVNETNQHSNDSKNGCDSVLGTLFIDFNDLSGKQPSKSALKDLTDSNNTTSSLVRDQFSQNKGSDKPGVGQVEEQRRHYLQTPAYNAHGPADVTGLFTKLPQIPETVQPAYNAHGPADVSHLFKAESK